MGMTQISFKWLPVCWILEHVRLYMHLLRAESLFPTGFPGSSDSKESTCKAGDLGLIPGLGRSLGGGHENPLQYFCLENPDGLRSLTSYIQSIESQRVRHDWVTKHTHTHTHTQASISPITSLGLKCQMVWELVFLVQDPWLGWLIWGLDPFLLRDNLWNCD